MVSNFSLPPQVYSVCFVENGETHVTDSNWEQFKHFFDWVNKNDIEQRILRLKGITLNNERSIVVIYGDSQKIIEFERKNLDFVPPPLSAL